ncbi:hypothetical protein [Desulfurococcus mucosus]|uniref:Uncharacterized protein n=1 Tax=Desulfurococcus mucosus (strain ATCC 35584 / DSM 2162 / JCM 9187 / O7/1) TaxID=765177 RepID=E8R7C3_DESM0|nr:hypothetical protein [Desulfurococcus mucosus]ADV65588.1 hypothetical protein Desmu_1293 [Desulfurococcus mucosus DSM 2162]
MRIQSLIIDVFETARNRKITYRDFFKAFMSIYGVPARFETDVSFITNRLLSLAHAVDTAVESLDLMVNRVRELEGKGYVLLVVDCIGLPELYEIYTYVAEAVNPLSITVEAYINGKAMTYRFKYAFGEGTMLEVAKRLGASIHRYIDKTVHRDLGDPVEPDTLVELAKSRLKPLADDIARDALNSRAAIIVADHGYDVGCRNGKCYLEHGEAIKLAKISPLIIMKSKK